MMLRLSLLTLLTAASAQLVFWNRTELQEKAAAQQIEDVKAAEGFVNPKICDSSVKQTAGYLAAGGLTKYFFWLFESKSNPSKDPLIMWLSGGPGCSSQLALFAENGPCRISKDGRRTTVNPYSWHANANVMWVDQPAGVGFSTGLGTHNEKGVAENMWVFLQNFAREWPEYMANGFYIFGESYAGHYVPAIGHQIYSKNKAGEGIRIPLKGVGIGNGLTDPEVQYRYYPEMGTTGARDLGGHAPAGVINSKEGWVMKAMVPPCIAAIHYCNKGFNTASGAVYNATACLAAYDLCNLMSQIPYELTGKNPYNMNIPCEHGRLCYDFDMIGKYLNSPEVKAELGVTKTWGSCNYAVNLLFAANGDWMVNYNGLIPDMLADGIKVLIYAGDLDYICNWLGNLRWTQAMNWPHKAAFNAAENKDYTVGGQTMAKIRTSNGFSFMQVFNAGHMVPMDQPEVSLQMVKDFTVGSLGQHESNSVVV